MRELKRVKKEYKTDTKKKKEIEKRSRKKKEIEEIIHNTIKYKIFEWNM